MISDIDVFCAKFDEQVPSEDAALEVVWNALLKRGYNCRFCGGNKFAPREGRLVSCLACKKTMRFTADTFFSNARSVRALLAATFMLEQGLPISDKEFARRFKISQATAWYIMRSIGVVLAETCDGLTIPLECEGVITKRSRHTPSGQKPGADIIDEPREVKEMERSARDMIVAAFGEDDANVDKLVQLMDALRNGALHFDQLYTRVDMEVGQMAGNLTMLVLHGLLDEVGVNTYQLKAPPKKKVVEDISAALATIKSVHGGVSRRYVHLYVAVSEYVLVARVNHEAEEALGGAGDGPGIQADDSVIQDELLMRCLRFGPVPQNKVTGRLKRTEEVANFKKRRNFQMELLAARY